jgi:uncharacterized membrane protein YhaH (DUF805 family)
MVDGSRNQFPLWKAFWIVCPATYLIAIALFALTNFVTDRLGGHTVEIIAGQEVRSVSAESFKYGWYNSVAIQVIAVLHACLCTFIVLRYRRSTRSRWLAALSIAAVLTYLGYTLYCTYGLFHPDPNLWPITY